MDVPAAAAGPWIALGAVLGILLLLAAGAVALRLRTRAPAPPGPGATEEPRDDLADFLSSPPGTPGARDDAGDGWAALAPAPPPPPPVGAAPVRPGPLLTAFAVAALLLVGTAAALAAASRPAGTTGEPPAASASAARTSAAPGTSWAPPAPDRLTARLSFAGVVLEEHAVGLTAAHPELELALSGDRGEVRLRLPAVNCLAAAAPPAPGDPACRAARTEYAELSSPDLRVARDGDDVTVSGRFATRLRPPGGGEEPTGRSYDVAVTLTGGQPAGAVLVWDGAVVPTRAGG
ncbi:hypothetical protein [Blastococcus sp. SYSU D01042]